MIGIKLLKSILISTLGISAIGTIASISTSCGEKKPIVIHVTDVILNKSSTTLDIGKTETLTATVLPEDATDKSVTWTSDNESVATVDNNGKITAVAEGIATITVKTNDGDKTATCSVTVSETVIHVTDVILNKSSTTLDIGKTETLTATVLPEEATDKSVTWTSDNESVATVDSDGKITAVAKGTATITVKTNDGDKTATCAVTVNGSVVHVTDVTLDETSVSLDVGTTKTLTATVLPEDATDKSVTWTSDNESVATVDSNGKITAVAEGTATITVKTNDGDKTATCSVTVNGSVIHVTDVTLNKTTATLAVGDTVTLTATVSPEDATDKLVTWTSDNESVATIDSNGKITAVAEGTATITVKTNDGDKTATCKVAVSEGFINIHIESGNNGSVSRTDVAVGKGSTFGQIKSKLSPQPNPSFEVYEWMQINGAGYCISEITDDYEFVDNVNLKVLFNRIENPQSIATQEGLWGEIKVKYKLLDNHECRLLTKYEGADGEYGYVSGTGTLVIPDHVIYDNKEPYYIRQIPSDWSDGENDITGLKFDHVEHLETICNRAFYHTCALDRYTIGHEGFEECCVFPEGLTTIGDEAFCGTSFHIIPEYLLGYSFPSTLKSIGKMAFQHSINIGCDYDDEKEDLLGVLTFRSEVAIGEDAFWNIYDHYVKYVYAPTLELAQQMKKTLEATGDFEMNVMEPLTIVINVTGVSLNKTTATLAVGETEQLTATVSPKYATDKSVTWTSDNESVATVDSNGKITAVAEGTATITVKTNDGDKTATCAVTVNEGFINIHIKSGNNGSVSKTDVPVAKGSTFGQIKSKLSPQPNKSFKVYEWIRVDESDNYISEITDDYVFVDNVYLKVLFNRTDSPHSIATQEGQWGEIKVKYKLLDNHECRLLTKYEGADGEYGYVSGTGTLVIPDHVIYDNKEPYYIRQIPSDWSDGENDITGLKFDHVEHLETICNRAFYHTCALDYYNCHHDGYGDYCEFPEGLKTIGDEAFCGTTFASSEHEWLLGYSFPSTLESIGEMAFQHSPCIGKSSTPHDSDLGVLIFKSEVDIGEDAFQNDDGKHSVKYVYAPTLELAQQIIDALKATGDFNDIMEPKEIQVIR